MSPPQKTLNLGPRRGWRKEVWEELSPANLTELIREGARNRSRVSAKRERVDRRTSRRILSESNGSLLPTDDVGLAGKLRRVQQESGRRGGQFEKKKKREKRARYKSLQEKYSKGRDGYFVGIIKVAMIFNQAKELGFLEKRVWKR